MKKTLCIALCALTLLALAACGAEQSAQESAQFTPGTAAPEPYEPGAKLEISAPTLDDAEFICLSVPASTKSTAVARWDFSPEEKAELVAAMRGIVTAGSADGPVLDEIGNYVSGPKRLYSIEFTCIGDIDGAFGQTTVLYSYGVYEDNIIALPGSGYLKYDPESFDIDMLSDLIANRPMPEHSQEDIESAVAAARSFIEGWEGIVPGDVWYDAEADALWSGTACHDNFNRRVSYDLDYITVCFNYSSPSGETVGSVKPGEDGCVVMVRFGGGAWIDRVWTPREPRDL